MSAPAKAAPPPLAQVAERRARDAYGQALVGLARRGNVPAIDLGHLAIRVLLFLLGQRPGYFAHQQVIADAVESNLTSVRTALGKLRDAGLVSWELIPPHHHLPTGRYTRTNVNQYFVETDALLHALGGVEATPPRRVASTHPNSDASSCTDPKFEQHPPLPPSPSGARRDSARSEEGEFVSKVREPALPGGARRATGTRPPPNSEQCAEVEPVLAAWRDLKLGEPDHRSVRALKNRLAEGRTIAQLLAAVEGAREDEWLQAGRAKVPFAVVFASSSTVARFASEGLERAKQSRKAADQRAKEPRKLRELLGVSPTLTRTEYAELAAQALRACERWPAS